MGATMNNLYDWITSLFLLQCCVIWMYIASFEDEADGFCGGPGKPRGGVVFNHTDRYHEGSIAKFSCDLNHFVRGDLERRCVNGTWSGHVPVCMRQIVLYINTGNITGSSDNLDNKMYDCKSTDRGGRLFCKLNKSQYIGGIELFISSPSHEGQFQLRITSPDGRNSYNTSFPLGVGKSFFNEFKEPIHGDTVEIEAIGRTANSTFDFKYEALKIYVISGCGEPEIPLYSEVEYIDNDTSIYKCITGYRVVGNKVRRCQKSGTWTGDQVRCMKEKLSCGSPGIPANGIIKRFTRTESFVEGYSVEYDCFHVYWILVTGNKTRTCINGSWTGQIPVCARRYRGKYRFLSVCRTRGTTTTKCDDMPGCLTVDNKPEFWKINLDKRYHIYSLIFSTRLCLHLQCKGDLCVDYFNISVSTNSTIRYLNRGYVRDIGGICDFEYYMVDNGSPLANSINIAVNNLPTNEQDPIRLCNFEFYGSEYDSACGRPDSPLHSVFTFRNDNRTAFFKCKPGYQAVGNTFDSRCTNDLRWTQLNMKCIKSEDTQTAANDLQLAVILVLPFGLLVFVLSTILGKILYGRWQMRREEQDLIEELQRMKENRQVALNPDVAIDEQSDVLPYDRRWEFPLERLKLGRSLGEGAFGTVMKAKAIGILAGESTTTVAVKMVKYQSNKEHLMALMSELKILAYVGHHINIVNLLGAVTKNLAKGELMVITEYCEFGNLRNFLLCQRDRFMNQIDPETGGLSTNINAVAAHSADAAEKDYQHQISRDDSKYLLHWKFRNSLHESRQKILSLPPDSTSDLISYSFQCARGMEFLSSKKLVHRDLAARNVLLAENKVIKICDFGLSRKTYEEYAYVRKGKGPLPIKWMAIESICDRVFTTKSDVWSFGVLLWEVFTLGADPYPGAECNKEFIDSLKGGYRLKKPDLAPNEVYNLMQQTWQENPKDRPTFTEIADMLGNLLEESVRSHYLDLNAPHAQFNEAMAQDMQFEPTMVSDSRGTGEDIMSEIRESDMKTDPLVCIDAKVDAEVQSTADLASLDESKYASDGSCETTRL